jgi:uncharacterized protein (DUF302 family)
MKRLLLIAILSFFSIAASANGEGIVKLKSKYSVSDTIDRVEIVAKANGHRIWHREDFQKLGEKSNVQIRPNQLIMFGRGKGGPRLIAAEPMVSLDLPLKVIAWEDEGGQVWLAYTTADYWRDRHRIKGKDKIIANINKVLKSVVDEAMK